MYIEAVEIYVEKWIAQKIERDSDAVMFYHEVFNHFLEWLKTKGKTFGLPVPLQFDIVIKENGFTKELTDSGWYIIRGMKLKSIEIER